MGSNELSEGEEHGRQGEQHERRLEPQPCMTGLGHQDLVRGVAGRWHQKVEQHQRASSTKPRRGEGSRSAWGLTRPGTQSCFSSSLLVWSLPKSAIQPCSPHPGWVTTKAGDPITQDSNNSYPLLVGSPSQHFFLGGQSPVSPGSLDPESGFLAARRSF